MQIMAELETSLFSAVPILEWVQAMDTRRTSCSLQVFLIASLSEGSGKKERKDSVWPLKRAPRNEEENGEVETRKLPEIPRVR